MDSFRIDSTGFDQCAMHVGGGWNLLSCFVKCNRAKNMGKIFVSVYNAIMYPEEVNDE